MSCHSKTKKLELHGYWPKVQIAIKFLILGIFQNSQYEVGTRLDGFISYSWS